MSCSTMFLKHALRFYAAAISEMYLQMVQDIWQEGLHGRTPFLNLPYIQTLLHHNHSYCIDLLLGRLANLFLFIYGRIFTEDLSSVNENKLQHRFNHSVWIMFAFHTSPWILQDYKNYCYRKQPSRSIHSQKFWLSKVLRSLVYPCTVSQYRTHRNLEIRLTFLHLVRVTLFRKFESPRHSLRPHTVRCVQIYRRVVILIFNSFQKRLCILPESSSMFHYACTVLLLLYRSFC